MHRQPKNDIEQQAHLNFLILGDCRENERLFFVAFSNLVENFGAQWKNWIQWSEPKFFEPERTKRSKISLEPASSANFFLIKARISELKPSLNSFEMWAY